MPLYHAYNALTNTRGDSLVGFRVQARIPNGGAIAPIYSDGNGTPISVVSGIADTAVTDDAGNYSFFIEANANYDLEYSTPEGAFVSATRNVPLFSGIKGDPGDTGASDSAFLTLAALKAIDPAKYPSPRLAAQAGSDGGVANGLFSYQTGNFSGRADVVQVDGIPLTTGALVRQPASSLTFRRSGSSKVLDLQAKAALVVHIEDFGAVSDGVTDSTAAFELAFNTLPNGQRIQLQPGRYILKRTLIWKKAFVLIGAGKEQCDIHFAPDGNYLSVGGGARAANIFLHPSVVGINGYDGQPVTGYAGRSIFDGVTFSGDPAMQDNTLGMFIAAPIYGYESDVVRFTSDGVHVNAGADRPTAGNANGCTFTNVNAQFNKQSGFVLIGNDANRCILAGCNSAANGAHGYYDESIIGNTFIACEADGNGGTSFIVVRSTARSVYASCYSETPPHFNVGPRCVLIGMQGNISPTRAYGGSYFGGMPSGDSLFYRPIVIAESEVIGNVMGDSSAPGKAFRISENGIGWRMMPGQELTGFTGTANYAQWNVNGQQSTLWCAVDVTDNLKKGVQWAVGGLAFGTKSAIMGSGSAPPTTGSYTQGAIWLNDSPAAGGKIGWVCVASGSPGTWKAWGVIDA